MDSLTSSESDQPLLHAAMSDLPDSPRSQARRSQVSSPSVREWAENIGHYYAKPAPPEDLWDVDDLQFLEKVRCRSSVRIIGVDAKTGCFQARMKCNWTFRTLNTKDRTEVHYWVPGIRMPGLVSNCEESRIWRDMSKSSERTIYWCGVSIFSLSGFEIFEMEDFPFDRQVINLELLEFVWRRSKDSSEFDLAMKVVAFSIQTTSMLPEWTCYPAIIKPEEELERGSGPMFASRFQVRLRTQREHWFYVVQIFLVTTLITTVSCFPLAMPPTEDHIGDRLSLYGGGILTLVAFKYGIADHLPSVPYSTFADTYLLLQVVTIMALALESTIVYRWAYDQDILEIADTLENVILGLVTTFWGLCFCYVAFFKRRKNWKWTLEHQSQPDQVTAEGN